MSKYDFAKGLMDNIQTIQNLAYSAKSRTLIDASNAARVEPPCVVDATFARQPYAEDVLQSVLNQYSAFYLAAFSLSVPVGGINVLRRLDALNPNRDPSDSILASDWSKGGLQYESYDGFGFGLGESGTSPLFTQEDVNQLEQVISGPLSSTYEDDVDVDVDIQTGKKDSKRPSSGSANNDASKEVRESGDLSVGKLLKLELNSNGNTTYAHVQIRLRTVILRDDIAAAFLTPVKRRTSFRELSIKVKAGVTNWWDIITAKEEVAAHMKNLVNDDTGLYRDKTNRERRNQIAAMVSGRPSLAGISQISVITNYTKMQLESSLRMRFKNARDRQEFFDAAGLMMLVFVDTDHEVVDFYYNGIDQVNTVSISGLQRAGGKGKDGDIMKILTALNEKKAPVL